MAIVSSRRGRFHIARKYANLGTLNPLVSVGRFLIGRRSLIEIIILKRHSKAYPTDWYFHLSENSRILASSVFI